MKTKLKMATLAFGVLCLLSSNLQAQDGSLDLSFGNNGIVTTHIAGNYDKAYTMCTQPDSKILVAGFSHNGIHQDFTLVRYHSNGSIDLTFGLNGIVITNIGNNHSGAFGISLQPDGKILLAGSSQGTLGYDFTLVRYNTNGSIDSTFDFDGIVVTSVGTNEDQAEAILLQPDGKILVAGRSDNGAVNTDFSLVRYNTDGSLDLTFDTDGKVITDLGSPYDEAKAISLQPDGKILLAGNFGLNAVSDFAVLRYNTDGSLDTSFDGDGIVTTDIASYGDFASAISLQPDGKILVAGMSVYGGAYTDFSLVRYNSDGSLDHTLDSDGMITTSIGNFGEGATDMCLQPDGKILLAGFYNNTDQDFALIRYNSDGSLDLTFDSDGIVTTFIGNGYALAEAISLQPDGKILVAGTSGFPTNNDFALARYNNTITPINKIENPTPNLLIYPNPFHSTTTIEFGTDLHDAELSIYNVFGQKVKTISNISDSMIRLNRDELASGFYVVCLVQDKKVVATGKLVVD